MIAHEDGGRAKAKPGANAEWIGREKVKTGPLILR